MDEKLVLNTVEEVKKVSGKGKLVKRLVIFGGAVAGLVLGGWWLSKKAKVDELEDFDDTEDFEEEEENTEGSDGESEEEE